MIEGIGEIDVADMLEELGLENVQEIGRGEVQFSCPRTDNHSFGDSNPSAHMNKEKLVFRCKGCGWASTALDMVGFMLKGSPIEALRWLRQRYGEGYREPHGGSCAAEMKMVSERRAARVQRAPALPNEMETIGPLGMFAIDWASDHPAAQYMRVIRGFSPQTLHEWGIGYDTWTSRIAIPLRDEQGNLVGFKGRAVDVNERVRYSLLGDVNEGDRPRKPRYGVGYGFDMHETDGYVFALHLVAAKTWQTKRKVAIVEGELDAIALWAAGVPAVAVGMTSMSNKQLRLLRWYLDIAVSYYDSDQAGFGATWGTIDEKGRWHPGIVERMSPYLRVLVAPEHDGDPASMNPEDRVDVFERAEPWLQLAIA